MPSTRKRTTQAGGTFYEIRVSRGRNRAQMSMRWYPPDGWSKKAIDRELAAVAAEFERQCDAGEVLTREEQRQRAAQEAAEAAKILTVRQYGEKVFMPAKAITMAENSRANFQINLDKWIYPALGECKLTDITPAQIAALLLSMQSQGKAHATVIKCYTVLNILFKMAYLSDMVPRNPMDKVERPRPRKDEGQANAVEAYTVEELCHILECLKLEPLKWRAYMRLLIDTGIRRGECCGLQWKDVDFQANTVTISGNLCYTVQRGVYMDTPKNGRVRVVDVDPDVIALLQALKDEQNNHAKSLYVFTQDASREPMHPQSPTRYMKKFSQRYHVPGLHPHKLRHSFASVAITSGADIASVSEKLGHSDKAVTLRMYTHASEDSMKKASQIFRDALKKAGQG